MRSLDQLKQAAPRYDWTRTAVRATAVAAALTAVTTLIFVKSEWFYPPAISFEERAALVGDRGYQLVTAVHFVHPLLFLLASFGVWRMARRVDAALALFGIVLIGAFAFAEALRYAWVMVTVNWGVLAGYTVSDEPSQALVRWRFDTFTALSDGLYFLLACAYALGELCLGWALVRVAGLTRLVAIGLLVGATFAVLNLLGGYAGAGWASSLSESAYPILHPVFRLLTAWWLWVSAPPRGTYRT